MRFDLTGNLVAGDRVRAGFIGCGSHSFRNVYPALQFAPIELVATCDLQLGKAEAFARQFGAERAYADHQAMLATEELDAVFVVLGYDDRGWPLYPDIAVDCLDAGCHVWIEKPPAATVADIDRMAAAAGRAGRQVMVGFKKMFAPANVHADRLARADDFGTATHVLAQYPQFVPTVEQFERYLGGERSMAALSFLDHLCHPASLLLLLLGPPSSLYYERTASGSGQVLLGHDGGRLGSLALTWGSAPQDGLERTTVISDGGAHIVVEDNQRVSYHRAPFLGYGDVLDVYATPVELATVVWEPEHSLGQLYNKGLVVLGYQAEIAEFAAAVLEGRPVAKAGLDDARVLTKLFEAFAAGPGTKVDLT